MLTLGAKLSLSPYLCLIKEAIDTIAWSPKVEQHRRKRYLRETQKDKGDLHIIHRRESVYNTKSLNVVYAERTFR